MREFNDYLVVKISECVKRCRIRGVELSRQFQPFLNVEGF